MRLTRTLRTEPRAASLLLSSTGRTIPREDTAGNDRMGTSLTLGLPSRGTFQSPSSAVHFFFFPFLFVNFPIPISLRPLCLPLADVDYEAACDASLDAASKQSVAPAVPVETQDTAYSRAQSCQTPMTPAWDFGYLWEPYAGVRRDRAYRLHVTARHVQRYLPR